MCLLTEIQTCMYVRMHVVRKKRRDEKRREEKRIEQKRKENIRKEKKGK